MPASLPPRANLDFLKKQAKHLLKAQRDGTLAALERFRQSHPNWHRASNKDLAKAQIGLRDAQLVVAREYGLADWQTLTRAALDVESDSVQVLAAAIRANDLDQVKDLLAAEPGLVTREFVRINRRRPNGALTYAANRGNIAAMELLLAAGAAVDEWDGLPLARAMGRGDRAVMDFLLERGAQIDLKDARQLMGPCEGHSFATIEWLLDRGVDPNYYSEEWDCTALTALLQTYTRSEPAALHACINRMIEAGASFADGPVMDIHRGDLVGLAARIKADPDLVHSRFGLEYGNNLTLRGVTLLHVAADYNERECVDLLLEQGADLNAPALVGNNGVGGQTPIYHTIGSNQGSVYSMFEYLLDKGPDLGVKAFVQGENSSGDPVNKGRDHFYDEVFELTPLGYALRYADGPDWRQAKREAQRLQALGAPA